MHGLIFYACISCPVRVPSWGDAKQPAGLATCVMFYQPGATAECNAVTALPPSKVQTLVPFLILLSALRSFQASKSKDDRKHRREKMELLCNLLRDFAEQQHRNFCCNTKSTGRCPCSSGNEPTDTHVPGDSGSKMALSTASGR